MAPMTECVASSISRWHGCKAEYYLLSCSTHSDVRWRDDRRRGPDVSFSEVATNRGERQRIADTASYLYTKVELLGRNSSPRTPNLGKNKMRIYFSAAGQSFGHAATNWHSKSYYRHEQVTICFLCLYSFESQFLW